MREYRNANYKPYGAADLYSMDFYVDDHFKGNVLDELLQNGFEVTAEPDATGCYGLKSPSGETVASLLKVDPQERYDAANTVQVKLKLNTKTDAEVIAKLNAVPNKQGYIKALILADLKK